MSLNRNLRATLLSTLGLLGGVAALVGAAQGCGLLVCFEGDPGCGQASAGGGGAGTGGSTTTGNGGAVSATGSGSCGDATGTATATGCGPTGVDCHGGECCEGQCLPVLLPLPPEVHGRYIAAAAGKIYIGTFGPLATTAQVAEVSNLEALAADVEAALAVKSLSFAVGGDPVPSGMGFMAARDAEVFFSGAGLPLLVRCNFGSSLCTPFGNAGHAGLGFVENTLYAARGQGLPLDTYDLALAAPSAGTPVAAPESEAAGGFAVDSSGAYVAWSLTGTKGCVAVVNPDKGCGPVCSDSPIVSPTGVALGVAGVSSPSPVFFLTEPAGAPATLWRSTFDPQNNCALAVPEVMATLSSQGGLHTIALDDTSVYVVDTPDSSVGNALKERVLACPRALVSGTSADCTLIVDLGEPVRGVAVGDGIVYFISDTMVGWKGL